MGKWLLHRQPTMSLTIIMLRIRELNISWFAMRFSHLTGITLKTRGTPRNTGWDKESLMICSEFKPEEMRQQLGISLLRSHSNCTLGIVARCTSVFENQTASDSLLEVEEFNFSNVCDQSLFSFPPPSLALSAFSINWITGKLYQGSHAIHFSLLTGNFSAVPCWGIW